MINSEKTIFNVPELCEYLHISQSSARKLIRTNSIPYYRVLSKIFFDKHAIDNWIEKQQDENSNQSLKADWEMRL